jgi:hypothetical protein
MPAPTTFRAWRASAQAGQARGAAYRASPGYVARRTSAIFQRGLTQASAAPAVYAPTSSLPSGCSNVLVSAGVSCAQQAGLTRLGAGAAASLQQQQRAAAAAGTIVSRNSGGSAATGYYPPFPAPPPPASAFPTSAYNPNAGRFTPQVAGLGSRLAAMRAQMQGYRAAGAARVGYPPVYAPTLPGTYTAGGYQTTGPDTTPAPPPPAAAADQSQPQLPAPITPTGPAPAADPRQALQVFQQSRTARGLPTVNGLEYLPSIDALAQQLLMTADPDGRGAVPYTLGHVYQVISEQAVRLGDLALAQVYASLAARYPAPPAMAGFGAVQLGGVSLGGWALTAAVAFGAAVGLLAVRDARRPARSSGRRNGRSGRGGRPHRSR